MTEPLVSVGREESDGRLILGLRGEIDLSNVEALQEQIVAAADGHEHVVVDLATVDYIDSQGLRLLHRVSAALTAAGSRLEVVAPPESAARFVLDMTRMTDELVVRDALEADVPADEG